MIHLLISVRRACVALMLCCIGIQAAHANEPTEEVALNFVNADIGTVIRAVSKITQRNFVVDPRVKGTLNIHTNTPVSADLAYQILLSALRLQGYAVVENRGVTQVVPEADAKQHSVPVSKTASPTRGDSLITQVFSIKNESAVQLVQVIRPLVAPNNPVTAYANNNTLVVTDYAENVNRIARIIDAIDVPQSDIVVFPVQHASAVELATTVTRLLNDGGASDSSQRVNVIADERTNALLVRSDNPSRINAVRLLVNTLDRAGTNGNIHVVHLKNADATKLAQTLHGMLTGQGATPGSTSSTPLSSAPTGGASRPLGSPTATGATGIVQADAATNSLIITAPEATYNNIRRVIDMLDRRRAQVYIEALIAEVSADRFAEFGIQWQSAKSGIGASGTTTFGGTNFGSGGRNILGLSASPGSAAPGLNLAVGNGTITLPGTTTPILNLTTLARFLEAQTDTNIVSTPNLVMLDNEEAKIVVGQNLPFITGSFSNTGGSSVANPFQTISRQDVGLTLRIKPQISEGGAVHLQIYEESSSVVATTTGNASGPTTNKRSIETTALVDDGAIIALGGLVEDSYSSGVDKVPLLGDIPLLGSLFRYDTRQRKKTNLIVFIRPKILRDAESYRALTNDRYDYVIGQQRNANGADRLMMHEAPAPQLPQTTAAPAALGNDQTAQPANPK